MLDPVLASHLERQVQRGRRPYHRLTVAEARAQQEAFAVTPGSPPTGLSIVDEEVALDGRLIPVRRYRPLAAHGTVIYAHGGGWTLGTLDGFDAIGRALALESSAEVVSVGYRLAPEDRFPAAADDVAAITRWASDEMVGPLAIAGDSAGGNLAAVVAARHPTLLAAQVLFYPVVDASRRAPSYALTGDHYPVTGADMDWFIANYLPDAQTRADPDASPLLATGFDELPPTLIVLAGHDPLLDEGREYANRLIDAGRRVVVSVHPTMTHGFAGLLGVVDEAAAVLRAAGAFVAEEFAAR